MGHIKSIPRNNRHLQNCSVYGEPCPRRKLDWFVVRVSRRLARAVTNAVESGHAVGHHEVLVLAICETLRWCSERKLVQEVRSFWYQPHGSAGRSALKISLCDALAVARERDEELSGKLYHPIKCSWAPETGSVAAAWTADKTTTQQSLASWDTWGQQVACSFSSNSSNSSKIRLELSIRSRKKRKRTRAADTSTNPLSRRHPSASAASTQRRATQYEQLQAVRRAPNVSGAVEQPARRRRPKPAASVETRQVPCEDLDGNSSDAIAICFYGLIRNIRYTLDSLRTNLLAPIRDIAPSDVFIHSLVASSVRSTRFPTAGEANVELGRLDFAALQPCRFELEDQDEVDESLNISERSQASFQMSNAASVVGDGNGNRSRPSRRAIWAARKVTLSQYAAESYANIMRSRYSMWRSARLVLVHEMKRRFKYSHIVVARPDTAITAPLHWQPFESTGHPEWLRVPNFAHNYGLNDRFAYGTRAAMLTFMRMQHEQLQRAHLLVFPKMGGVDGSLAIVNSESWLCNLTASHRLVVGVTPLCVVRMRGNGRPHPRDVGWRFRLRELPQFCKRAAGLKLQLDAGDSAFEGRIRSCPEMPLLLLDGETRNRNATIEKSRKEGE